VESEVQLGMGTELEQGLEQEIEPDFIMPVETDVNWEAGRAHGGNP